MDKLLQQNKIRDLCGTPASRAPCPPRRGIVSVRPPVQTAAFSFFLPLCRVPLAIKGAENGHIAQVNVKDLKLSLTGDRLVLDYSGLTQDLIAHAKAEDHIARHNSGGSDVTVLLAIVNEGGFFPIAIGGKEKLEGAGAQNRRRDSSGP